MIFNKSYIYVVVFYWPYLLHNNEGIVNQYCADLTCKRNSIVSTQTIVYNIIMTTEETSNRWWSITADVCGRGLKLDDGRDHFIINYDDWWSINCDTIVNRKSKYIK